MVMNNLIIVRIQALVGVLSLTALAAEAQDTPGFRAGTAVVDISPTVFPMQLRSGPSDYVHDPLHVRAIAFENGEGRAVIAVVDAIEGEVRHGAVSAGSCPVPAGN